MRQVFNVIFKKKTHADTHTFEIAVSNKDNLLKEIEEHQMFLALASGAQELLVLFLLISLTFLYN